MSVLSSFETSKTIPVTLDDLTPVANDVMDYFRAQEYEVAGTRTITGGWRSDPSNGGCSPC